MSARACARCGANAPSCATCTIRRATHRCGGARPGSRASPASSSASRSRLPARPRSGRARPKLCRPFEPGVLLALTDQQLAAAGLSRPKIRTLRAIADACTNGLDLAGLDGASEEQVHAALTEVVGIGPWTADVYIMFCLGRADGWAPGDLALQVAAQRAMGLDERPAPTRSRRSASAGGPGAAWRRDCCGPTTRRSNSKARRCRCR